MSWFVNLVALLFEVYPSRGNQEVVYWKPFRKPPLSLQGHRRPQRITNRSELLSGVDGRLPRRAAFGIWSKASRPTSADAARRP